VVIRLGGLGHHGWVLSVIPGPPHPGPLPASGAREEIGAGGAIVAGAGRSMKRSETAKLNERSQFRLFMSAMRNKLSGTDFSRVLETKTALDNVARNAKGRPGGWSRVCETGHRLELVET
jgi:hypothetical protein